MKKLMAIALSALLLATPIFAGNSISDLVKVEAAKGTITVDANVAAGEWDDAKAINITLDDPIVNEYGHYDGGWGSDRSDKNDFETNIKFKWDDKNLYILEERKDDEAMTAGDASQPWAGGDGNLIFIQVIDSGTAGNEDGYGHHVFYTLGNGNDAEGGQAMIRKVDQSISGRETVEDERVKIAAKKTSTGWVAELAVPWEVFQDEIPTFTPADNVAIAMSCVPIDCDADGALSQLCWFDQAGAMGVAEGFDFGGWATLTLAAAPVVETQAPATEAPVTQAPVVDAPVADAPAASQTADMGIIAALAVLAVASGAVLTLKKR